VEGGSILSILTKRECIRTLEKIYKPYEIGQRNNNSKTLDGSSGSLSPMSNNTGGDARVPQGELKKSRTEVWREKYLFFTFRISS
jgi:hypothetical protein